MASNLNQNISTEFENPEKKKSFWVKVGDFFSGIGERLSTPYSERRIKSAKEDQERINTLSQQLQNPQATEQQKQQFQTEIDALTKERDRKLNYGNNNRFQRTFILPIEEEEVYKVLRSDDKESVNDFKNIAGRDPVTSTTLGVPSVKNSNNNTNVNNKAKILQAVIKKEDQEQEIRLIDEFMKDKKIEPANIQTRIQANNGQEFLDRYKEKNKGNGVQGYINKFVGDVVGEATPYTFSFHLDDGSQRFFFKEEAPEVIYNIIMQDDIYKAVESNYNVVKKVEERLDSDDDNVRKHAESNAVQNIYKTAIKNLDNLKEESKYLYENMGRFDGHVFDIMNQYKKDHNGRKMFSTAHSKTNQTSEDRGTTMVYALNVHRDMFQEKEYPSTWKTVKANLYSPIRSTYNVIPMAFNMLRTGLQGIADKGAEWSNTFYNYALDDTTFADFEQLYDISKMDEPRYEYKNYKRDKASDYTQSIQMGMSSMGSLRNKLLRDDSLWATAYNKAMAAADAGPTISKEALTFYLSEKIISAAGVVSTSDMVKATAMGSDKYSKIAGWEKGLLKFSTADIIRAKTYEFAMRGIVQNAMLSTSATSNFSEEYTDIDFGLDLAFGFIDVFALGYGATIGKGKIVNEARKNAMRDMLRQGLRDTLNFTDDQRKSMLMTVSGRKAIDETAGEFWRNAVNAVRKRAEELGVSEDEIINEFIKASKERSDVTKMVIAGENTPLSTNFNTWSKISLSQDEIVNLAYAYRDIINSAAINVIKQGPSKFSKSITDKLGFVEKKAADGKTVIVDYYWKEPLTYEEFAEIVEKSQVGALSRLRKKFNDVFKKGKAEEVQSKQRNYAEEVAEVENIDTSTAKGQVEQDIANTDLNTRYDNLVRSNIENIPNEQFRRREYEKYGKPNGYEYGDIGYTAARAGATREEVEQEFYRRRREFAKDYDNFFNPKNSDVDFYDPDNASQLTTGNIKLSESMIGKDNLIGLSFKEASKFNINLLHSSQAFFEAVSNSPRLELYQKNAILWSIPKSLNVEDGTGAIHVNLKKGSNVVFGSSFEKDYVIGNYGSVGVADISLANGEKVRGAYVVYKDRIDIKGNGFEYVLPFNNGVIKASEDMDIVFDPATQDRYSFDIKFYNEGKDIEKKIKDFAKENPDEMQQISNLQIVEEELSKERRYGSLKETKERNRYQSQDHDEIFSDKTKLSNAEFDSGYLNVVDIFDVPFSYYIEVKKDIALGKLDLKEGAVRLLMASDGNVRENADYFIIDAMSSINRNLLLFMFHQSGIVMLPDRAIKYGGFKPYIYERVEGTLGLYNIYSSDNKTTPIGELGVSIEGDGKTYVRMLDTNEILPVNDYRLSKHFGIDYDSSNYTHYAQSKYQQRRDNLFDILLAKEQQGIYNTREINRGFDLESPKDVANKFSEITKRGGGIKFNNDVKVSRKNVSAINNIFNFKNLSLRLGTGDRKYISSMFYNWFETLKIRTFNDKLGVSTIDEGISKLKEIQNLGLDYEKEIFGTFDGGLGVIIDTKDMGFSVNYLSKGTDRVAINTLAFRIDTGNGNTRILSIGNMPNLSVIEDKGELYLNIASNKGSDKGVNYLLKLDNTIRPQERYRVNPLSLSNEDYKTFIEVPTAFEDEIAGEYMYDFILSNLEAFPSEVADMVLEGASVSDVYTFMKNLLDTNEVMAGVVKARGKEGEPINLEQLFDVYNESLKLRDVIFDLYDNNIIGRLSVPTDFFEHYKRISGAEYISQEAYIALDNLGLGMFLGDVNEHNLKERYRNIYAKGNTDLPIAKLAYTRAQYEIVKNRISLFLSKIEDYKEGLDLSTIQGRTDFMKRVQDGYEFATQVIKKEDMREQYDILVRQGVDVSNMTANDMLYQLQAVVGYLEVLRLARGKIKNNIRQGIFKPHKGKYSGYTEWQGMLTFQGDRHHLMYDVVYTQTDEAVDSLVSALTGAFTNKQALKQIDLFQNMLKKRARKLINNINNGKLESPKSDVIAEANNVEDSLNKDVDNIVEDTPAIKEDEIETLKQKEEDLIEKTDEGLDNSQEIREYIDEKEAIQEQASQEVEKTIQEFKQEEIKTEKSQIDTTETKNKKPSKKQKKIEEEDGEIQVDNNIEKQIKGNYAVVEDMKTEDLMEWFETVGFETDIRTLLSGDFFLDLIEKLSQKEGWKMPAGNIFLQQIQQPHLNKDWKKILSNDDNIGLFLKSEEGMEYMLYSLYYHVSVPYKFIDKFNELFGTNIDYRDNFVDGFNTVYNTYKDYYGLSIEVQQGGMINIDKGNSSKNRSMLNQLTSMGYSFDGLVMANYNRTISVAGYKGTVLRTKDEKFIKEYNKYIDKSISNGAFLSKKYRSGPMNAYEYWTLKKYGTIRKSEGDNSVINYIKSNGRFSNISYGKVLKSDTTFHGIKGSKGYYELLVNKENLNEFNKLAGTNYKELTWTEITDITLKQLLSPYYYSKIKDILDLNTGELKDISSIITVSSEAFIDNTNAIMKNIDNGKATKIIIQGGNINELKDVLNKYGTIDYEINKYLDEVEVTPKTLNEEDLKKIDDIATKNIEDSLDVNCR